MKSWNAILIVSVKYWFEMQVELTVQMQFEMQLWNAILKCGVQIQVDMQFWNAKLKCHLKCKFEMQVEMQFWNAMLKYNFEM